MRCAGSRVEVVGVERDLATVADYIDQAPSDRREALALLRRLCQESLPGFVESIRYGMPSYSRDDVVEIAFASQKRYISLYVTRSGALQANVRRLEGLSVGKGCVRFTRPDRIDASVVRALLDATVTDRGTVC
jgi:uncharacterized protein YdhG (YjbR/CyaY superfamily)